MDKDGAYVLRLFNSVDSLIFINTDFVKAEEMKSARICFIQSGRARSARKTRPVTGAARQYRGQYL